MWQFRFSKQIQSQISGPPEAKEGVLRGTLKTYRSWLFWCWRARRPPRWTMLFKIVNSISYLQRILVNSTATVRNVFSPCDEWWINNHIKNSSLPGVTKLTCWNTRVRGALACVLGLSVGRSASPMLSKKHWNLSVGKLKVVAYHQLDKHFPLSCQCVHNRDIILFWCFGVSTRLVRLFNVWRWISLSLREPVILYLVMCLCKSSNHSML